MNYTEPAYFLEHKMSMSHVYQPLLVRAFVDSGGTATLRQVAHVFLSQDESQLLYYERRIKDMPLKVLKRHGVIESDGQLVSLRAPKLTLEQNTDCTGEQGWTGNCAILLNFVVVLLRT